MNKFTIFFEVVIIYCLIAAIIYFISNYSIFVPPPSTYDDTAAIKKIVTKSGKSISTLYLENPNSIRLVIYSHGNAEDLGMIRSHIQQLYNLGYSVLAYDYSGYGTSQGSPSENATYENIQAVYEHATNELRVQPEQIVLYGRSLGSGPSIDLASHEKVGAMILESPFVSAFRVVTYVPIFPVDKYKNLGKMKHVSTPTLFIHGTNDTVVPFWHGKKLYNSYKGPKEYYWVEGAGHNNIPAIGKKEYEEKIKVFIDKYVE